MTLEIGISIEAGDWPQFEDIERLVFANVQDVFGHLGYEKLSTEISVLLTDDAGIQKINAQWRGKDTPTNVLSFPGMDMQPGQHPGPILGDIALSFDTLTREANQERKTFEDHFCHLLVHGLLHLLGYDHEDDKDADQMEQLEIQILHRMGIENPYAVT